MEGLLLQDQPIPAYKEGRTSFNTNNFSAPCSSKRKLIGTTTTIYGNEYKRLDHFQIHGSCSYRSLSGKKPPLLPLPLNTSSSNLNMHQKNLGLLDQHQPSLPTQNPMLRKLENREKQQHVRKKGPLKSKSRPDLIITCTKRLGPDPSDLKIPVPGILRSVSSVTDEFIINSVSRISSPHPSSLPLPRFSMKNKKVGCNVQAGGVDKGATDDLRRLLKLH